VVDFRVLRLVAMSELDLRGSSEPQRPVVRSSLGSKLSGSLFVLLAIAASSCGATSVDTAAGPGATCGDSCFDNDAGKDTAVSDVSTDVGNADASQEAPSVSLLCGSGCLPDDPHACGASGAMPDAGMGTDASEPEGEATPHDAAVDVAYNKGGAYPAPAPGPDDPVHASCQVVAGAAQVPVSTCMPAGSGVDGDPCVSSADCAPGLACVGDETTGVCRPYCCAGPDVCAAGTWCSEKSSRDGLLATPPLQLKIPVCVPGADCILLPQPNAEKCPQGTVCTVVRNDGTLACLPPGTLGEGQTCDDSTLRCAEGFVCSRATMTCLRLCHANSDECGSGVCQAGSTSLPDGIGICVGSRG
jgi:hypothetical protein